MIVECLTDNRNRTAGDVRSSFAKGGGSLAAEGAVAWNFERRGVVPVRPGPTEDAVVEAAIEAGAEDVVNLGADGFEVRTHPNDLHAVAEALSRAGLALAPARVAWLPKETVRVGDAEKAQAVARLVTALEDLDDVQHVYANADIDDGLLEQMA
jgi:YebC/PmpR family DNA-binding regulatory protein